MTTNSTDDETILPEPPDDMTGRSQTLWRAVVFPGCGAGRLEAIHSALLALDRADEAAAILKRDGLTTTNKATGVVHIHPAQRIEKDARTLFHRVWKELDLTSFATPKPFRFK